MASINRRVVWAPLARRDLSDIWRYYTRVATVDVADKLLREIDEAARRLSENALRWRARDELTPGLRSALVPPYAIFYRVKNGSVEIVRVLHGRRNLGAIFSETERR
jgi:toxin ParE1/3/4